MKRIIYKPVRTTPGKLLECCDHLSERTISHAACLPSSELREMHKRGIKLPRNMVDLLTKCKIYLILRLTIYQSIRTHIHLFHGIHSFIQSVSQSDSQSFIHSFIHSFSQSVSHPIHSFIQPTTGTCCSRSILLPILICL